MDYKSELYKPRGKIIGVIGARILNKHEDFCKLRDFLRTIYNENDIICSGGCSKGADKFAKTLAIQYKLPYLEFPANWDRHGKEAGFIRNVEIAKWSQILVAMVVDKSKYKNGQHSGGTEHTIDLFIELSNNDKTHLHII